MFQPQPASAAPVDTTYTNSGGVVTLANSQIQLTWETTHGTLTGLKNLTTGTQYITGNTKGNWILFANANTASQWNASLGTEYWGASGVTPTVTETVLSNGIEVNFTYASVGGMSITLIQHVTLTDYSPVSDWSVEIDNNTSTSTGAVVTAVITPQINGVGTLSGESLAYPYEDGEIIPSPGTTAIDQTYPMPLSMQWMALYNSNEGIYYSVLDSTAAFKELRFGYDSVIDPSPDSSRIMGTVLWPFVQPSQQYVSPTVEVATYSQGGWWWAADRYRDFINTTWMPVKHYSSEAAELTAFGGVLMGSSDQYSTTMPSGTSTLDAYGISNDVILGWNYGGFDDLYPDFTIDSGKGGTTGLQTGITAIHNQGNKVSLYINAWDADSTSNWYQAQTPLGVDNTMNVDGTYPPGLALDGHTGYTESPSAAAYQTQLTNVVGTNRTLGASFQFIDQAMEAFSYLDYNSAHGQSSPATSYSAGYLAMMTKFQQAFNDGGLQNDYYFIAEGINDYLSPYIDVGALEWGNGIGYNPSSTGFGEPAGTDAPQLTRYTIPNTILGLPQSGYTSSNQDEYAWAFLMGEPLLQGDLNPYAFPRYLNIYKSQPDIYFYGTYKDSRGLSVSNSSVVGTTITGKNSDRMGIQLHNTSASAQTVNVTLDYSQIGFAGVTVNGVQDLEGGAISYSTGTNTVSFSATVNATDVKAYMISLNGGIR
jgi:hypothetical protein